ncbi:MAG: ribonuclease activity regulator RraA [Alphaproteobacteria bacterium]|nr:ribonuclease activity regulator RraA [Alphaproteobacteria bacterium]
MPLDRNLIDTLRGVSTATLTMQLLKRGLRRVAMEGVRPMVPMTQRMVGEAFTLAYLPLREDLSDYAVLARPDYAPRRAIEEAPAGAVLVIDARGEAATGIVGDILTARLRARGVAGIVTDGGLRDVEATVPLGLPIYAAGPASPPSIAGLSGAGMQGPIGCGRVAVIPGDVIVGDQDGVVVVPKALASEVARDGAEQERLERFIQIKILAGAATPGVYPANDVTRAEYKDWIAAGEPWEWRG